MRERMAKLLIREVASFIHRADIVDVADVVKPGCGAFVRRVGVRLLGYPYFPRFVESESMKEIASVVPPLLAFLVPVGFYCMLLALINRRNKPLMVRGAWDAAGLLGAISGFLLWTMPAIVEEFCQRVFDAIEAPVLYSALWILYFVFLTIFCTLLVYLRSSKTVVYNVETKVFNTILEQSLARIGLGVQSNRGHLLVTPAKTDAGTEHAFATKPTNTAVASDARFAQLTVEPFAPMFHMTLHWDQCEPYLRRQIEEELERGLDLAAPEENGVAGWFYTVSGLIFGALLMVAAMIVMLILFPRQ